MIILNNYSKVGTFIVLESNKHSIVNKNELNVPRNGVGGFSENGDLLGIYVIDDKFYFLYNNEKIEVIPSNIKCVNNYITNVLRRFTVEINDKLICDIKYEPYIDPGMIYYDADPEEFDFLLYLSGLLNSNETIINFIKGIQSIRN
jgi:hypothetical protein